MRNIFPVAKKYICAGCKMFLKDCLLLIGWVQQQMHTGGHFKWWKVLESKQSAWLMMDTLATRAKHVNCNVAHSRIYLLELQSYQQIFQTSKSDHRSTGGWVIFQKKVWLSLQPLKLPFFVRISTAAWLNLSREVICLWSCWTGMVLVSTEGFLWRVHLTCKFFGCYPAVAVLDKYDCLKMSKSLNKQLWRLCVGFVDDWKVPANCL